MLYICRYSNIKALYIKQNKKFLIWTLKIRDGWLSFLGKDSTHMWLTRSLIVSPTYQEWTSNFTNNTLDLHNEHPGWIPYTIPLALSKEILERKVRSKHKTQLEVPPNISEVIKEGKQIKVSYLIENIKSLVLFVSLHTINLLLWNKLLFPKV